MAQSNCCIAFPERLSSLLVALSHPISTMPKAESTTTQAGVSATRSILTATPRKQLGDLDPNRENQNLTETPYLSANIKLEEPEPVEVSHRLAKKTCEYDLKWMIPTAELNLKFFAS